VADRVDAAVDRLEATELQSVLNGAAAKAKLQKLGPAHEAVLALRKRADRPIHLTRAHFAPHYGVK